MKEQHLTGLKHFQQYPSRGTSIDVNGRVTDLLEPEDAELLKYTTEKLMEPHRLQQIKKG